MKSIFDKAMRIGKLAFAIIVLHLSFFAGALPLAHADDTPPSRVARLNYLDGTVSFSPAGTDDWSVATPNRPLTIGDRIWVDKDGRSELHVGSTAMRLAASTSLELLNLSDDDSQLKVTQGSFSIRVRDLGQDENMEIDTPNLAFVIREPGEYRVDVDPDRDITMVTVRRGSGVAYGSSSDNRSVPMKTNNVLTFAGDDLSYGQPGSAAPRDPFDRWIADRDGREDNARSVQYVSRDMTGYEDLDDNGEWSEAPGYGSVWVPRVTVRDWAPYHYGHWTWVAPWGWTWVDDERWGFAPFHYGRWARIDDYWAWVPGPRAPRPVYAPALVGFVGGGDGGTHWGVSLSAGTPGVAWFALAPGERYRPAYTSNTTYITNINRTVIVNKTEVRNTYINQRVPNAIAAMPASEFVRGRPANEHGHEIRPESMRDFSKMPSSSSLPVAPVRQSLAGPMPAARALPPARAQEHNVVARRQAPEAPVYHDALARKFAAQGSVPGAGPVFAPTARPVRNDAPAANQGNTERPQPDNSRVNGNRPGRPADSRTDARGAPRENSNTSVNENTRANPQDNPRPDDNRRPSPPPPQAARPASPAEDAQRGTPAQASRPTSPPARNEASAQAPARNMPMAPRSDTPPKRDHQDATAPQTEVARPPVSESRHDAMPQRETPAAPDRRPNANDAPRPAMPVTRPTPAERPQNDNRMPSNQPREERQQHQQPEERRESQARPQPQVDRPTPPPSQQQRRSDQREARPPENKPAAPQAHDAERPPQAQREERPERPQQEHRDERHERPRPDQQQPH